jgi:hypothetical protein
MTNLPTIIEDLTLVPVPAWWENPWVWVAALVALVVGVYLFRRWLKSRPTPVIVASPPPPGPPPHLEALRRLTELRAKQKKLTTYDVALECSDILRAYIEGRFALPIRYQTTREFLGAAQAHPELGAEPRRELGEFLAFFDGIKFAADSADSQQMRETIDGAERFVRRCIPAEFQASSTP